MPITYRKRLRIFKWLYLNISRRDLSLTQKVGPVSVNHRRGRTPRVSVNGPGGFGWRTGGRSTRVRRSRRSEAPQGPAEGTRVDPATRESRELPGGFDPRR